jgi:hypothetical protein
MPIIQQPKWTLRNDNPVMGEHLNSIMLFSHTRAYTLDACTFHKWLRGVLYAQENIQCKKKKLTQTKPTEQTGNGPGRNTQPVANNKQQTTNKRIWSGREGCGP